MSVGATPYPGGQLHVGPVDCTSCKIGDKLDNGEPDDSIVSADELGLNVESLNDDVYDGEYHLPSMGRFSRNR